MNLVTTQQTAKSLKLQIAMSYVTIVIGFLVVFVMVPFSSGSGPAYIGGTMVVTGILWMLVTRIRIWWNHE